MARRGRMAVIVAALATVGLAIGLAKHRYHQHLKEKHKLAQYAVSIERDITKMLGGEGSAARKAVAAPEHVTPYSLVKGKNDATELAKGDAPGIAGYAVDKAGAELPPDVARRISAIVLDPMTYAGADHYWCFFSPGWVFQFKLGSDTVNVMICLHCHQLVMEHVSAGKATKSDIFDLNYSVTEDLFNALRGAFPADPKMPKLAERLGL